MNTDKLISQLVLSTCCPGQFHGKEAHHRLNRMANTLHNSILHICSNHSKADLLKTLYDEFDEACFHVLNPEYWSWNDSLFHRVQMSPSIFRYLIETTLISKNTSAKQVENETILTLVAMAGLFLQICNYSDYMFYNDYRGGFEISREGKITFSEEPQSNIILEKIKLREMKIVKYLKEPKKSTEILNEVAKSYDDVFKKMYTISLTEVVDTIVTIIHDISKKRYGAEEELYKVLIKELKSKTGLPRANVEKAIGLFELDDNLLSSNWKHYKFYDIRPSVSRQPIIHITGRIGKFGIVLFGPCALTRALTLLFSDIERGVIDLGDFTEMKMKQKGIEFENAVRELFRKYKFKVLHVTDCPEDVGDIDAVAYNPQTSQSLFVVEAKSPKINLTARKIKWHQKETLDWSTQLKKKIEWVIKNIGLIKERLTINEEVKVKGIIVTEVPVYYDETVPFSILTIDELELLLNKKSHSS